MLKNNSRKYLQKQNHGAFGKSKYLSKKCTVHKFNNFGRCIVCDAKEKKR